MKKNTIKNLDFGKMKGLIPAVIQDNQTNTVLMLGYMNLEALNITLASGFVTFFSRKRQVLWQKGESSGNVLKVVKIFADCDNDSLLIRVNSKGNTCHTGSISCFKTSNQNFLNELFGLIKKRKENLPKDSYTTSLFEAGLDRVLQKVGEESIEVVIAGKNKSKQKLIGEVSDLLYHLLVMLVIKEVELDKVISFLYKRRKSGKKS